MRICGCADLRSGKMRRFTADIFAGVMGKMRLLLLDADKAMSLKPDPRQYATNDRMPIAYLHYTFTLNTLR